MLEIFINTVLFIAAFVLGYVLQSKISYKKRAAAARKRAAAKREHERGEKNSASRRPSKADGKYTDITDLENTGKYTGLRP